MNVGRRLGPYELVELLGAGGMASVYRARRVPTFSGVPDIALKVVDAERHRREPWLGRALQREGLVLRQLQHRNIVRVLDVGEADGSPYVAMELVQGVSLAQLLAARSLAGAPGLQVANALEVMDELLQALEYAHDMPDVEAPGGVVHRDLKPGNVLIGTNGSVKLVDFGIAKALSQDPELVTKTVTGTIKGTLAYMSPEQMGSGHPIGPPSDLFALAAVGYEAVLGRRLFPQEHPGMVIGAAVGDLKGHLVREDVEARLDGALPGLAAVLMPLLEPDPADRPQAASLVLRDLRVLSASVPRAVHGLRTLVRQVSSADAGAGSSGGLTPVGSEGLPGAPPVGGTRTPEAVSSPSAGADRLLTLGVVLSTALLAFLTFVLFNPDGPTPGATARSDGDELGTPMGAVVEPPPQPDSPVDPSESVANSAPEVEAAPAEPPDQAEEPSNAVLGRLLVMSMPSYADVTVDGEPRGQTPVELDLPLERYEVRISKRGFHPAVRFVELSDTEAVELEVALESTAAPTMPVIIASNPGGALVFVDGKNRGPTPLTVPLKLGVREVRLEAPGLPPCERRLVVTDRTRNAFYDLNTCR